MIDDASATPLDFLAGLPPDNFLLCSGLCCRDGQVVKCLPQEAGDLGSILSWVVVVVQKSGTLLGNLVLWWSVLGLVGPASVYCDWVRWQV